MCLARATSNWPYLTCASLSLSPFFRFYPIHIQNFLTTLHFNYEIILHSVIILFEIATKTIKFHIAEISRARAPFKSKIDLHPSRKSSTSSIISSALISFSLYFLSPFFLFTNSLGASLIFSIFTAVSGFALPSH